MLLSRQQLYKPFVVSALLLVSSFAWGQATINENLETAYIYVDANSGSDGNPGTQAHPLKTIGAAAALATNNNHGGIGSRVIVNPGTYRESLSVGSGSRTTSSPITIQAATNGTVFISGADVWSNWVAYSGNSSIYTQSWPYQWGLCEGDPSAPIQENIIMRREMVIVNGTPMTEVLSLTAMRPGTFFPDESHSTVYVWPPSGTNMSAATVEVSTRPSLFTDAALSNLVLRGLTFQYANSCHQTSAVGIAGAQNVLLDTDQFLWNNAVALTLTGTQNFTVQNSISNHNGQMGVNTSRVKKGLWQSDTASYNNWRGAQGAYYSYDTGGGKFLYDHNGNFQNFTALFNQTHGMHFDTDNANFTVNGLLAVGNADSFLIEKSEGPATISNSTLCGNSPFGQTYQGGITILDSESLTYTGNTLYGNGSNQINFTGSKGGFPVTNWETGQVYQLLTENLTLQNNLVAGNTATQVFSDSFLGGADWNQLVSTLTSDNNTWWAGTNNTAFTVPSPKATKLTLSGWQSQTGQDMHSKWASMSSPAACNVAVDHQDFQILTQSVHAVTASPSGQAAFSIATLALGGLTGTVSLTLDGLSTIPGATANFSPASLTTNGNSTLTVTTSSSTPAGTYPVNIIANTGNLTHTMTVALLVPKTSVRLSTTTLSFSGQQVKTSSSPKTLTVTNTGNSSLGIGSISLSGNFSQTNNCGGSISAGAKCTINVTFSPRSVANLTGTLKISDADATSPQSVSLSGTGTAAPQVQLSPSSLSFGQLKVGISTSKTTTVSNSGTAALALNNMTITGNNSSDFSQTSNCGSSLAEGKSCLVTVTFKPSGKSTRSASLSVFHNDPSAKNPQTVNLSGCGS
jgi:Abnormal spindle-like microcephaly-assoc'd, ASPM-SPD-2-Hydin